ncbi:MAG: T9SS type A sorting domain-containing protein [Bacteroidota bacterium]
MTTQSFFQSILSFYSFAPFDRFNRWQILLFLVLCSINGYTQGIGDIDHLHTATAPNGNFITVWDTNSDSGERYRVSFRKYHSSGTQIGSEQQVGYGLGYSRVALNSHEAFVITWLEEDREAVKARLYNASGVAVGSEIEVALAYSENDSWYNRYVYAWLDDPDVGIADNGQFTIIWKESHHDYSPTPGATPILGQRYTASGQKIGDSFLIATDGWTPRIAMNRDGSFIVIWDQNGIRGQRYSASGSKIGQVFEVIDDNMAIYPSIKMAADGSFIVHYQVYASNGNLDKNYIQPYNQYAAKIGNPVPVPGGVIAMEPKGNFAIGWSENNQFYTQRYASNASKIGAPTSIKTLSNPNHGFYEYGLSLSPGCNVSVAWAEFDPDWWSAREVFSHTLAANGSPLRSCFPMLCSRYTDSLALVDLYNTTNGANWTTKWNLNDPLHTWKGVVATSTGCVTGLILTQNNLVGTIPYSLTNMVALNRLYLNKNKLSGSIPDNFDHLTVLEVLSLGQNQLSGAIPTSIGDASKLRYIALESNNLTGTIPASIGNLAGLHQLYFQGNNLTGELPNSFWDLVNLKAINVGQNNLTGTIPERIGKMTELFYFSIAGNDFYSYLPDALWTLEKLDRLWVNDNAFWGTIPPEISNLKNLTWLDVSGNMLWYFLPSEIGSLSKLKKLDVSSNYFDGDLPMQLGQLSQLEELRLDNNLFYGTIPEELGNLRKLQHLNLSYNELSGRPTAELATLTNLKTLRLNSNYLGSCYPSVYTVFCQQGTFTNFSDNPNLPDFSDFCTNGNGICTSNGDSDDSTLSINTDTDESETPIVKDIELRSVEAIDDFFELKLTPNPATDYTIVHYRTTASNAVDFVLYDMNGRVVKQIKQQSADKNWQQVRLSLDLLSGLYLVEMRGQEERVIEKLMIQN